MKLPKYIALLIFTAITISTLAQLPALIPYRKGDLWGYCDSNKVVKIEPRYASAWWFNELGQAHVQVQHQGKSEFIDSNGLITQSEFYEFDSQFY